MPTHAALHRPNGEPVSASGHLPGPTEGSAYDAAEVEQPSAGRRPDPIEIGLLAVRVLVLLLAIRVALTGPVTDDVARFHQIAVAPGTPYRDFPVEYAPLELLIVRGFGSTSAAGIGVGIAIVAFASDIAAWAALRWGWGRRSSVRYLWLGTPLLVFMYVRIDLLPVALAAWGAALAVRSRERAGGLAFAAAILTKLWALVVLPGLAIGRRSRALAWAAGAVVAGALVWVALSGTGAISQVTTFRGATGWGVESVVGTVVWILTGGPVRIEAGAPRVGTVPPGATVLLAILLAGALWAIWTAAWRTRSPGFGGAALAAVAALLVASPLLSLQYVSWLLPWGALAALEDRSLYRLTGAVALLTMLLFIVYDPERVLLSQLMLVIRNATLIALPLVWTVPRLRRRPIALEET
jgi:hypothetical protein